ncbi:MAG TPA: cytochrome b N-terminal domain-containing protein [Bryobacteraceae bacterium]|nr:cytochrome b N-terminal domain-containing protein [Bryobacteraceae bacterium]
MTPTQSRSSAGRVVDWFEERTGLPSAIQGFFNEEIPASAGWPQVFGSVALFGFMVQLFTGVLLAMNYAPTPGEAWHSVRYIMTELTGGAMIRGLHHWGASLMIVVVVLHMVQVFLWGAYKKPREATWMIGVILLLLTLAYGLTGYLLPWDNRAYWGTVVATQIGASVPGAGPWVERLLGSENGIGAVTFARFYAIHVLLLPPATLALIGLHVYLVRRHGVAPAAGDTAPRKRFFPGQVMKDTVAIFIAFAVLFVLAVTVRVPLERMADPTDTSYIPRPDWYFLFLFQMLKFFEGSLEIIGSVVLPQLAILALLLTPFIDRGAVRRVTQRRTAMAVVAMGALVWTGLTVAAVRATPSTPAIDVTAMTGPEPWQSLTPVDLAGAGHFHAEGCQSCHTGEKAFGPELIARTKNRDAQWLIGHFKNPQPGSAMPAVQLTGGQMSALATFLIKATPETAKALQTAPPFATEGAIIYMKNQCGACHQVNGHGSKLGPALNGLQQRRTRDWIEEHFVNPQKLSPGTSMPPYKFSSREMDRITSYLLAIP